MLRKIKHKLLDQPMSPEKKIEAFIKAGKEPWTIGYPEYRQAEVEKAFESEEILSTFAESKELPKGYGKGLDERVVEYPWILSRLTKDKKILLDAGSTFNFDYILKHLKNKDLHIYTYFPEENNYNERRISYTYGDLRLLPYRDNYFEEVVCQSTIEHIGMDNSMYGYDIADDNKAKEKNYDFIKVTEELVRVLKSNGILLLTFPFGTFEHHGFFQQFDPEMVGKIESILQSAGTFETNYYHYHPEGWQLSSKEASKEAKSYNPHTGAGKGNDGAAHSRAICVIKFIKS